GAVGLRGHDGGDRPVRRKIAHSHLPLWHLLQQGVRASPGKQRAELNDPIDEAMEARFDATGKWRQPPLDIEKAVFAREVREMAQDCLETLPQAQRIAFYFRE